MAAPAYRRRDRCHIDTSSCPHPFTSSRCIVANRSLAPAAGIRKRNDAPRHPTSAQHHSHSTRTRCARVHQADSQLVGPSATIRWASRVAVTAIPRPCGGGWSCTAPPRFGILVSRVVRMSGVPAWSARAVACRGHRPTFAGTRDRAHNSAPGRGCCTRDNDVSDTRLRGGRRRTPPHGAWRPRGSTSPRPTPGTRPAAWPVHLHPVAHMPPRPRIGQDVARFPVSPQGTALYNGLASVWSSPGTWPRDRPGAYAARVSRHTTRRGRILANAILSSLR